MRDIITRYAPSPTGIPHVGNIRTALFNYLFAKNQNGKFILRIEDTDQKRSTKEHIEHIKKSLDLLKISFDDYYEQSTRLKIYQDYLEILKKKSAVYEDDGAFRFKVPQSNQKISWEDVVHSKVGFPAKVIEDFIVMKSDRFPTYHFASVIDDHEMQITHVMRGDEWISSTPKHLLLYEVFNWQPPQFCHLPAILGQDRKKLSKREDAKSVMDYVKEGYLPESLINFLALLGWAPKGDRELFTIEELISEFSLDRLNKNSPIFNIEKLKWFNQQWLKKLDPQTFNDKIQEQFPNKYPPDQTINIAPLVQSRVGTIAEFPKIAGPFYEKPNLSGQVIKAVPLSGPTINQYAKKLEEVKNWNPDTIRAGTASFAEENEIETKNIYRSLGVATFGSLVTPPLPESVTTIGKLETVERLERLAEKKNK